MVYGDVINQKLHEILPKKKKYTIADFKRVLKERSNLSYSQARFVVICTAIYHDAEISRRLNDIQ